MYFQITKNLMLNLKTHKIQKKKSIKRLNLNLLNFFPKVRLLSPESSPRADGSFVRIRNDSMGPIKPTSYLGEN